MRFILSLLASILFVTAPAQEYYLLVGTYDSPKSEGVYVFRFNSANGEAREISHIKTSNPSFIAISPDERFVYAVHEVAPADGKGGDIAAFTFNKQNGALTFLNRQLSGGDHPCHVEVDKTGKWVFAANYSSGTLTVLPVMPDGSLGAATTKIQHTGSGKDPQRQKGPHVHGNLITGDNRWLITTDLGIDKVMIYSFDAATGKLTPAKQPYAVSKPGAGPRQFTYHSHARSGYVINELSGEVTMYRFNNGKLRAKQHISTMPKDDTSFAGSADIHIAGRYLYASNRANANTIAIYYIRDNGKLKLIDIVSTLGRTPRYFTIDPTRNFLLVGNQNSDEIVIFKRDAEKGLLSDTGKRIKLGKPVCLKWVRVD